MRLMIMIAGIAALAATGCYTDAEVGYGVTYAAPAPDLVYVSPGVQVVADVDVPVFFVDGVYWRYDGGVWYSSASYGGGWRVAASVPASVRRIDRPQMYAHYRANMTARGAIVRDHRAVEERREPVVRDHRGPIQARAQRARR